MEESGIKMTGGNKSGIYVKSVKIGSPAYSEGIQVGWRIREVSFYKNSKGL